jgi:hypothetical protein
MVGVAKAAFLRYKSYSRLDPDRFDKVEKITHRHWLYNTKVSSIVWYSTPLCFSPFQTMLFHVS